MLALGTVTMSRTGRDGQRGVLGAGVRSSATASPWPGSEGEPATCQGADHPWAQPSVLGEDATCPGEGAKPPAISRRAGG